jgi:hypothetical protein
MTERYLKIYLIIYLFIIIETVVGLFLLQLEFNHVHNEFFESINTLTDNLVSKGVIAESENTDDLEPLPRLYDYRVGIFMFVLGLGIGCILSVSR